MDEVHLHKDYDNTYCGQDASHIPMTYELGETTCDKCKEGLEAHRAELQKQSAELQKTADETVAKFNETLEKMVAIGDETREMEMKHRAAIEAKHQDYGRLLEQRDNLAKQGGEAINNKALTDSKLQALPA